MARRVLTGVPREVVPLAGGSLLRELARALGPARPDDDAADRAALCADLRVALGVRHVFLFPDGRTGLYALLAPLGRRRPGAEVLLPDYNFFAVPEMVRRAGLVPVFLDVRGPHGEPDVASASRALTPRTAAVLLGHYFGRPNDLRRWRAFADAHALDLYEDCAHAFGASVDGRSVGRWGRGGFFSLSLTKGLTGVMGGAVVTDDDAVAADVASLGPSLGAVPRGEVARALLSALGGHALLDRGSYGVLVRAPHTALAHRGVDLLDRVMTERPPAAPPYAWPTLAEIPGAAARLAREHLPRALADVDRQRALAGRVMQAGPWCRVEMSPWEEDRRATGLNLVARARDAAGLRRFLLRRGIDARSDYLTSSTGDASRFPESVRLVREGVLLPSRALRDTHDADRLIDALRAWERQ